jgi:hypothetical protein
MWMDLPLSVKQKMDAGGFDTLASIYICIYIYMYIYMYILCIYLYT